MSEEYQSALLFYWLACSMFEKFDGISLLSWVCNKFWRNGHKIIIIKKYKKWRRFMLLALDWILGYLNVLRSCSLKKNVIMVLVWSLAARISSRNDFLKNALVFFIMQK